MIAARGEQVATIAARPRAARRSRRSLRAGIFWTSLGLLAAAALHEIDAAAAADDLLERVLPSIPDVLAEAIFTLLPLLPLALGIAAFRAALLERAHGRLAHRVSTRIRAALPADFTVLPHYLPRDSGDGEVDVVVVGPSGLFAIEVRSVRNDVACYQDLWFETGRGGSARLEDSPSRVARWNATRVQSDVALHGFVRTPVQPVVVFANGRIADVASSSVPVVAGIDALVAHLSRPAEAPVSPQRARAIAQALDARIAFAT